MRIVAALIGALALSLLPVLGLPACSGSKNPASPEPDAQADSALDPCAECNLAATGPGGQCAGEANTCNASPTCTALATCLSACAAGDTSCISSCANASPGAVSTYDAVGNCLCATSCAAVCGASCVGAYDAGAGDGGDAGDDGGGADGGACNACESAATISGGACYAEVSACMTSASCAALVSCLAGCASGDTTCVQGCGTSNSAGETDYEAVGNCLCGPACGAACAAGCGP